MIEFHQEKDIHVQCFKENYVESVYNKLRFEPSGETEYHYQTIKKSSKNKTSFCFK